MGNDLLFAELAIAVALAAKPFRGAFAALVPKPAGDRVARCPNPRVVTERAD
jgi:hypothetical protein